MLLLTVSSVYGKCLSIGSTCTELDADDSVALIIGTFPSCVLRSACPHMVNLSCPINFFMHLVVKMGLTPTYPFSSSSNGPVRAGAFGSFDVSIFLV